MRQWVLSVPFELRLPLARRADALATVGRILVEEVFRWQRECARELGVSGPRSGAVQFPQRFGGSLNLNVHYHLAIPDGVFARAGANARAEFHRLPRPTQSDLEDIALNVEIRVTRWLRRKGLITDPDGVLYGNQPTERGALDACLEGSLGIGELTRVPERAGSGLDDGVDLLPDLERTARRGGHHRGFDVHAGVVASATDRKGREQLLRYCARPPLSLQRLSVTREGLVAYRLRKPWNPSRTHRVMTPVQFMARLAALVPPPRHPLVRFHGVFAPHSAWRASVVPAPGVPAHAQARLTSAEQPAGDESVAPDCADVGQRGRQGNGSASRRGDGSAALRPAGTDTSTEPSDASPMKSHGAPCALRAGSGYIDWAELLKRVKAGQTVPKRVCAR